MKIFDVFNDYADLSPQRKFTLTNSENLWFKIYIFTKNDEVIDLVKELDTLSSLLIEHELIKEGYLEFCVSIEHHPDHCFVFKSIKNEIKTQWVNLTFCLIFGEVPIKMAV